MSLNNLTPGSTIEKRTMFKIVKVNKKSIVIKDGKGNQETVRERDYSKYSALTSVGKGESRANGRFPVWANTETKKDFVRQARRTNTPSSENDWKAYKEFQKNSK